MNKYEFNAGDIFGSVNPGEPAEPVHVANVGSLVKESNLAALACQRLQETEEVSASEAAQVEEFIANLSGSR